MKTIIDVGVVCLNLLLMMVVGMELEGQHFRTVFKKRGLLIAILIAQAVLLPAIGYILTRAMGMSMHVNAGILLLAACPVGDIANFYVLLARANIVLSVVVSVLSVLLSMIMMTFVFHMYSLLLQEQFMFAVPMPVVILRLLLIIVLPLFAGIGIRHFRPRFVEIYSKKLRNICIVGLIVLIVYIFVSQYDRIAAEWWSTTIASGAFITLSMAVGLSFGKAIGMDNGSVITVGGLFPVSNAALATVIAITLLNRMEYTVFAVVYLSYGSTPVACSYHCLSHLVVPARLIPC